MHHEKTPKKLAGGPLSNQGPGFYCDALLMKLLDQANVVTISDRRERRGRSAQGRAAKPASVPPPIVDSLHDQVRRLEQAIRQTEESRICISESASSAETALRRFEQTLINLRLSLDNQATAARHIDSAARAGSVAALLKAQILHGSDEDFRLLGLRDNPPS